MAKLTINLIIKGTTTDTFPDPVSTVDTWEVNWASVEKPLTSNPKSVLFGQYKGVDGDANETQRQEIIDEVSAWKDSPQQRKRNYQVPLSTLTREAVATVDEDWVYLSVAAKKFCVKLAKGIEGYLEFAPVITKTSIYSEMPIVSGCGYRNTPAIWISGYVYLKNGDRSAMNQDKTWTRTETWQGATTIDNDLYAATPPS